MTAPRVAAIIEAKIPPPRCKPKDGNSQEAKSAPKIPIRISPSKPVPGGRHKCLPILVSVDSVRSIACAWHKPQQRQKRKRHGPISPERG